MGTTPDYAIVFGTFTRPQEHYLTDMLASFRRAGVWDGRPLTEVHGVEGGSSNLEYLDTASDYPVIWHRGSSGQTAIRTSIQALEAGLASDASWIISCEDDVVVCGAFVEGVDAWITKHASPEVHVYTLYTPYEEIKSAWACGRQSWVYPLDKFYGTQALALHRDDARSLVDYFHASPWASGPWQHFDMMLRDWHQQVFPQQPHFLATVPCFVQHIGRYSTLGNDARFHQSTAWPGEDWRYSP